MITVTLGELLMAKNGLQDLLAEKLPVKTAYWLQKAVTKINAELKDFDAVRLSLVDEYGVEQPDGSRVVLDDNIETFTKQVTELLEQSIDLDITPIQLDSLGNVEISGSNMLVLAFLFQE